MRRWLTPAEAAALACVDLDVFESRAPALGIVPVAWMGATVYRADDIEAALEAAWRQSTGAGSPGFSSGAKAGAARRTIAAASAALPKPKRRPSLRPSDNDCPPRHPRPDPP